MRCVVNRRVETLGPLIREFIVHDSNVHSDRHAAYLAFFSRAEEYTHGHVNHKVNFVDPETGVHTQNIENLWSQFKKFKRRKGYSKLCYLDHYIAEFTLRKKYDKNTRWELFKELVEMCIKVL
ncbi:hypothetical protein PAPHI01_2800 [Pancytospora philotis]|nr:hypothetical protein PAPHI01_2800 [Pancytospora philotis]